MTSIIILFNGDDDDDDGDNEEVALHVTNGLLGAALHIHRPTDQPADQTNSSLNLMLQSADAITIIIIIVIIIIIIAIIIIIIIVNLQLMLDTFFVLVDMFGLTLIFYSVLKWSTAMGALKTTHEVLIEGSVNPTAGWTSLQFGSFQVLSAIQGHLRQLAIPQWGFI